MDKGLAVVLGMSLSYAASLAGMFIAVWAYKKNEKRRQAARRAGEGSAESKPGPEASS